jgi:hypothetical protein
MRKSAALPLGVALVLGLRPSLLHPSLQLIGIWLTPLLGTQFYVALSLAYMLFADPSHTPLCFSFGWQWRSLAASSSGHVRAAS